MKVLSPIAAIFLIVLVDVFGLALVFPLLPFYAEHFGATAVQAGALVSIYAAGQFIAGPFIGRLSDRYGRKRILLLSQVGTLAGFVLLALAHSLWLIILSRAIDGLTSGNISVAQAYVSDHTEGKERTRAFGLLGVAYGLGFLVGPAFSGLLAQGNMNYPIYLACALSFVSICATYILLDTKQSHHPSETMWRASRTIIRNPTIFGLLILYVIYTLAFSQHFSGLALFGERRFSWRAHALGPRELGFLFAYLGGISILGQGVLLPWSLKRFAEGTLSMAGFALFGFGFACLSQAHEIFSILVSLLFIGLGNSLLRPNLQSLLTKSAKPEEKGLALGVSQSFQCVAQVLAPLLGGYFIGSGQLSLWAWSGAGVCLTGLLLNFTVLTRKALP